MRLDAGSSRQALTITNLQYNKASALLPTEAPGSSDAGFRVETIPAGMPYSDQNRYSDGLPTSGKWTRGQAITRIAPTAGDGGQGWLVTRTGYTGPVWSSGAACTFGDFITANPDNNHVFRAVNVKVGVTGPSQPAWNTGSGTITSDNTCTWQESGVSAIFSLRSDGSCSTHKSIETDCTLCNAKVPRQPSEPAQLRFRPCTNAKRDSGLSSQRAETLHRRY